MPGLQGAGNPGVETPIPIQVGGDQGPLPSELQPKKVEVPVSAAPETAAAAPVAAPEVKSADGSPLDEALQQVDAAAGTAKAVDAVVPPVTAAGLSVQGQQDRTKKQIAEGDYLGMEGDLVENNVVAPPMVSGKDQPEPEEAEVIPEKDEKEVAPEPVVPTPPIVTADAPADPSRPITTGEPPIDYHQPVSPPAEPLPPLSDAPPVPAITIPQPPAPVAEVPNQAPVQPPAPAYPLNEPEVVMPKATGLPVPPNQGPVVTESGMTSPMGQELESDPTKFVDEFLKRNPEEEVGAMGYSADPASVKRAFRIKRMQNAMSDIRGSLSDSQIKKIIEELLEAEANLVEQGPAAAGGVE